MRTLLPFLALALVLPFAACAEEPEAEAVEPEVVAVDPAAEEPVATEVTVAGTLAAVQAAGGVLELPMDAAVANIDGWIGRLSGNEDVAPVVADLEALKAQLTSGAPDGSEIGSLLRRLGAAATEAAGDDEGLESLGFALTEAGNILAI